LNNVHPSIMAYLYSRMNDLHYENNRRSGSCEQDRFANRSNEIERSPTKTPVNEKLDEEEARYRNSMSSRWSSSDEDPSAYNDKTPLRSETSTPLVQPMGFRKKTSDEGNFGEMRALTLIKLWCLVGENFHVFFLEI
jgi:hypothetical protein